MKDYKSFTIYNSQLPHPSTLRNKIHADKNKIIFPNKTTYQFAALKDGRIIEEGFVSSNGEKAAVFNQGTDSFDVFNDTGTKISSTILKDLTFSEGVTFTFSDSRIFIIPESLYGCEGFEIRTSTGGFIRDLDICDMAGYTVSYDQRLFLVGSMNVGANCFFRVYNMDGIEVWKHKIHHASSVKIELSFDNRFAVVKLPEYWVYKNESDPYHSTRKENKLYIFDIVEQKLISEEDYTQ
ncbi:MAG: hypothetical protein ACYC2I_09580 [Elusimicrobiales bacterium]